MKAFKAIHLDQLNQGNGKVDSLRKVLESNSTGGNLKEQWPNAFAAEGGYGNDIDKGANWTWSYEAKGYAPPR